VSKKLSSYVEENYASQLPPSWQPHTKLIVQGLLAAGAVGVYMGKFGQEQKMIKDNSQALAAGTVAVLIQSLLEMYAAPATSTSAPVVAPTGGAEAAAGLGQVDVYEAALRGLNEGWNDYRTGDTALMQLNDYVSRPSMNDYVARPLSGTSGRSTNLMQLNDYVSRPLSGTKGQATELMALSDFNADYKRWE
jgi:hypothetical protein